MVTKIRLTVTGRQGEEGSYAIVCFLGRRFHCEAFVIPPLVPSVVCAFVARSCVSPHQESRYCVETSGQMDGGRRHERCDEDARWCIQRSDESLIICVLLSTLSFCRLSEWEHCFQQYCLSIANTPVLWGQKKGCIFVTQLLLAQVYL